MGAGHARARARTLAAAPTGFVCADTAADDPAQLYYTSGTTGLAKGIVHAHRYILGHEEFRYCHEVEDGERFHGMGEWAWAAGIAPLLGPWRLGALQCVYRREGGFDPHKQLDFMSRHSVTNVFTTPTAMRSMMTVENAGSRYPQVFRRACSAGEPLNPEAIRWFREQYGVTVLDYYGLTESYPLVANYPFLEVREGSMGKPMPGWDVELLDEDEQPVGQGERGEICLRARSNPHYPLGYWRNDEVSVETFGGQWFHTKDAAVRDEDGYIWYVGRADDVIIAAGYRIGPFEVESACLEHAAVREAAVVASPDELRGNVVKAFIVLADGYEPSEALADEIKGHVRERLSAYAYPRRIEFVPELPKTLTGKIRRMSSVNSSSTAPARTGLLTPRDQPRSGESGVTTSTSLAAGVCYELGVKVLGLTPNDNLPRGARRHTARPAVQASRHTRARSPRPGELKSCRRPCHDRPTMNAASAKANPPRSNPLPHTRSRPPPLPTPRERGPEDA